MDYKCSTCGYEGPCYGTPTSEGVTSPWCFRCGGHKINPMTKELPTWKDRFNEKFPGVYVQPKTKIRDLIDYVESEIIEAERRMKERCLECIPPDTNMQWNLDEAYQRGHNEGTNARNHTIRTAISSLK